MTLQDTKMSKFTAKSDLLTFTFSLVMTRLAKIVDVL